VTAPQPSERRNNCLRRTHEETHESTNTLELPDFVKTTWVKFLIDFSHFVRFIIIFQYNCYFFVFNLKRQCLFNTATKIKCVIIIFLRTVFFFF